MTENHGMPPIVLTPIEGDSVPRTAVESSRDDIHHLLSPIIGIMDSTVAREGSLSAKDVQWMIARLFHAKDVADALCGEHPARELMAEFQAKLAAERATS